MWTSQTRDWPIIMFSESVCNGGRHSILLIFPLSIVLFCLVHHRDNIPDDKEFKRIKEYSLLDFRDELARDLAVLSEYGNPPVYNPGPPTHEPSEYETVHMPLYGTDRKCCKVCFLTEKKELRISSYCSAPQCQVYLHYTPSKNCLQTWHSKDFHLQGVYVCFFLFSNCSSNV